MLVQLLDQPDKTYPVRATVDGTVILDVPVDDHQIAGAYAQGVAAGCDILRGVRARARVSCFPPALPCHTDRILH